ncbi:MAG TPA: glycosyltransferase family 39 protein [Gemmatimonadaceae bacterium]|nr:glycosyltransferase family 39 protein [Gemmatimonadaceae bacterium]
MTKTEAVLLIVAAALAFAAALLVPRYARDATSRVRLDAIERALRRFGPLVAAVVSSLVVWYTWGDLVPIAKVHDEVSYILQAEIFARGKWVAPSPPIPEFFEQPHVMVVPAVASKYPPGHALLLTPGALVGFPALMPLVLTGITAALIFGLAMRVFNPWVGALSWLLWLTAPIVLRFQPSFFSELTTTTMILSSWWALLSWRETRRRRWLMLVALCMGWCAITRPFTAFAFAIPIGVVVIRDVSRARRWADLALAMVVGTAVVSILPLWSAETTGNWRLTPIELYRRDYMAYDKIGFTVDSAPPRRGETPVLKTLNDYFYSAHQQQSIKRLPLTAYERVVAITAAFYQNWRLPLLVFAIAGLFAMNGPLKFAMLSVLSTFLLHLSYAHYPPWTIYYVETAGAISTLTAVGFWYVAARLNREDRAIKLAAALATALLFVFGISNWTHWRGDHHARAGFDRLFAREIAKLPSKPAIVFIHYTPRSAQHISVVFNYPDLNAAPVWVVHDLGPRNAELRRLAPNRASYDFDEDQLVGVPLLR